MIEHLADTTRTRDFKSFEFSDKNPLSSSSLSIDYIYSYDYVGLKKTSCDLSECLNINKSSRISKSVGRESLIGY